MSPCFAQIFRFNFRELHKPIIKQNSKHVSPKYGAILLQQGVLSPALI